MTSSFQPARPETALQHRLRSCQELTVSACFCQIHRPKWKGTGDGYSAVNSVGSLNSTTGHVTPPLFGGIFPSEIPLHLNKTLEVGAGYHNLFSSESPGGT